MLDVICNHSLDYSCCHAMYASYVYACTNCATAASAGAAQIHRIDGGDVMTSIQSLCAFHPALPVLAGINSSGRCHVFR
jgi:hypothetical protein